MTRTLPAPLAAAIGLIALAAIALTLFAWPQARSDPHELPIGVAGPIEAAAPIAQRFEARGDDFDVKRYADEASARAAIEDREVYGAIVASPGRRTLLTAPAASPSVAQLLEQAVAEVVPASADDPRSAVTITEVVPASADDPRGAAFSSSVLPMILLGIATGVLGSLVTRRLAGSLAFVAAGAALAGLTAVAIVQGWLGVLEGGWLLNAGATALAVLAIALPAAGMFRLIGRPGIGLTALVFVLIGNPWSGISTAPELLPPVAGSVGQLLPPGAAGDLLRGTAFFDGAGTAGSLIVLLAWSAFGLVLLAAAMRRSYAVAVRRSDTKARSSAASGPGLSSGISV
jgi:hypothetical protein